MAIVSSGSFLCVRNPKVSQSLAMVVELSALLKRRDRSHGPIEQQRLTKERRGGKIDVHINRSQCTVGNGAAEGTGKGESGVEVDTAELARSGSSGLLDDGIDLV